jgi:hypothetical protein
MVHSMDVSRHAMLGCRMEIVLAAANPVKRKGS